MANNNSDYFNKDYTKKFSIYSVQNIIRYFSTLNLSLPNYAVSLLGFSLFLVFFLQVLSGILIAVGFCPETSFIPMSRDMEDLDNIYLDDLFWVHERGVDYLFIVMYLHLLRKIFTNAVNVETESSWKSGVICFFFFHVTIFFGLVLCSTHLSDVTLRIASGVLTSFTRANNYLEWFIFTDQTLNLDTMVRMELLHYNLGVLMLLFGFNHGIDMHYDWKVETSYTGLKECISWLDEGLISELGQAFLLLCIVCFLSKINYHSQEPISYEVFTFGDLGLVSDVNFFAVAPHWYFRPFMAWLTFIPSHYMGLFGLFLYFFLLYFQPNLVSRVIDKPVSAGYKRYKGSKDDNYDYEWLNNKIIERNFVSHYSFDFYLGFSLFIVSMLYTASFLPYGRFFHQIGGNFGLGLAYIYIFLYLLFPSYRSGYSIIKKLIYMNKLRRLNKFLRYHVSTRPRPLVKDEGGTNKKV